MLSSSVMRTIRKKKIVMGMSGGVDSSVAAALLVREGHEVTGAFMKNWSDEASEGCGWKAERRDAIRVAAMLDIPLLTFDFEEQYRERVMEYMIREYAAGRTPNPDVLCNSQVKFDLFLEEAKKTGAEHIATGHYARVVRGTDGECRLGVPADKGKDQTYFLNQLSQEQLRAALFPLAGLQKSEVRALAKTFGLPVAEKKDSQGICFIGKVNLKEFLADRIAGRRGPIVTTDGHVVGVHEGIAPYTIGQRHGLGIGGGTPYFVVHKDMRRNTLVVAGGVDPQELYASGLHAGPMHWITGRPPALPLPCHARIRYRQPLQEVIVTRICGGVRVRFTDPQRAISPGQFLVLYKDDICLGGGVIEQALTDTVHSGTVHDDRNKAITEGG